MSAAFVRIKRAVRAAIGECAGIDGGAATTSRSRSTVGAWNALSESALPPLDCALALDEVAVGRGVAPPIVSALARELGGLFVPNIDAHADEGTASCKVMKIAERLGVLSGEVGDAIANDGVIDSIEATQALEALLRMEIETAGLRQILQQIADSGIIGPANQPRGAK